jgi:precorrin-6B C5,15-methyltransferase / cobalt-precorrin-6B C5,C15-methyltransferase
MITVVGWSGQPLREEALRAVREARLVVGGRRQLSAVAAPETAERLILGPLEPALEAIARHDGPAVVLASGDPGFFGIVRALAERFGSEALRVYPSVSSVGLAFGRVGLAWDDAVVVSAHGRDLAPAVNACRAQPKVAVLTGPGAGPAALATALRDTGRTLVILEDLGEPSERVTRLSPEAAAAARWSDLAVVLVLDPSRLVTAPRWVSGFLPPAGWALPEDAFAHRDSMITKAEVRALALARLGPRLGDLVWDIGAGSGSVAVECARLGAAAVALDHDADACERIRHNAVAHGVDITVVHAKAPDALDSLPRAESVFVGGGGLDVLRACAARRPSRLVTALAAVDRVGPARAVLADAGFGADGVLLQSSRLAALPDGSGRLAAANPVFVLWAELR